MTEEGKAPEPISPIEMRYRGPAGPAGPQGEQGRMLNRRTARSVVYLFGLAVVLSVVSLFWINHAVHDSQAAQQRQGQQVLAKLCATLDRLAALKPPSGSAASNPSRAYEQQLHATLAQLSPDIGCSR